MDKLCESTIGFNGADIESVVNEAIECCFLEGKTDLNENVMSRIIASTISISKSCKKQIEDMKKAFKENNFKDATSGKITV